MSWKFHFPPFRAFHAIGVAILLTLTSSIHAGPPLLTDDPDTPGPNHWEINTGFTTERVDKTWEVGAPLADINYGVGDNIQLKYQVQLNEFFPDHAGPEVGLGNSLVGVKWRFLDQTNWSWLEVSTYPQLEFIVPVSSGRRGLGERGDNLLLPIEIEHTWKKLTIYSEGGYILNQHGSPQGWYGVAAEYELTEKFSIMGEIYGGYDRSFRNDGASFNIGFARPLTPHAALIGAAGRGLFGSSERDPSFQSYLAIQWTF